MRKRFKVLVSLALTGALAVSAMACAGKKSEGGSKDGTTLTMINAMTLGDDSSKAYRTLLEKFQKENPEIEIDEETIANADLTTKVQTLAAADELPDIYMLKGQLVGDFVKEKKAMCLDELLDEDPEWKESFKEGIFSNYTVDEKIYGIPYQLTNTSIFYNKALFEKAGITEFPADWDSFIDACKKLKKSGVTPIVLGNKEKWTAESVIMSTLGNRLTGSDWYQSIREKSGAKFTDPEFVTALEKLSELAAAGAFNADVNSIDNTQQRQVYLNEGAAMTIDGSWAIVEFDNNASEELLANTEVAALPAVAGGQGDALAITGGAGWAYAINPEIDKDKLPAAKKFIRAMAGVEYANEVAKSGTNTVIEPTESSDAAAQKILAGKFNEFQQGRPYIPVYDHQLSAGIMEVMQSGLQELLINHVEPAELAQRIQDEYERE